MPQIFVLPEHIASQIAAGEVVERPASVVKELVENAIDAAANQIVIDIKEFCRYIRVADNGCGMDAADASLAFQRHATSKLTSANDLWNLNTLGFRGEALPSIASVSRLTCSTRTNNSEIGTKVVCMDGAMNVTETGCAKGTIIEVEELFYNVPARLSFLKKPATEFAHILDIMQTLAISHPEIAFQLSMDNTLKLKTSGNGDWDASIAESNFFSEQQTFITLSAKDEILGLELEGRLVSPKSFRGDRKGIMTIVNNRTVRCSLAYKALDYAYADLIPRGRYPLAVLSLKVKTNELDINIHPTKKEIRYSRGNEVYLFLQRKIAEALRKADALKFNFFSPSTKSNTEQLTESTTKELNKQLDFEPSINYANAPLSDRNTSTPEKSKQLSLKEAGETIYFDRFSSLPISSIGSNPLSNNPPYQSANSSYANDAQELENTLEFSSKKPLAKTEHGKTISLPLDWHLIGYFADTYILIENSQGLSIIEQHIAHERVLYEKLLAVQGDVERQNLLISLPLHLTAEQKAVLEDNIDGLREQGFEFEITANSVTCAQVPVELACRDYASLIQGMLQELAESSLINPKLDIVKSLACQSAIKNGMHLAEEQIIELLSEWYSTPRNETCPHGRPIQLGFSHDKLFQMFHPA